MSSQFVWVACLDGLICFCKKEVLAGIAKRQMFILYASERRQSCFIWEALLPMTVRMLLIRRRQLTIPLREMLVKMKMMTTTNRFR